VAEPFLMWGGGTSARQKIMENCCGFN